MTRLRFAGAAAAGVLALALMGCGGGGPANAGRVTVALDFTPNPAHSAIYVAQARGLDRKQGVQLSIRTPGSGPDSAKLLAIGRADIGVLDVNDLGLARERGEDLVGVAALVQRPLGAIIAQPQIARPRDLEGKRIGVSGLPSDPAFLRAVMGRDGGDLSKAHQITIGFGAVTNMIARKIDAVPAFWNDEGVALREHGIPVREFRVDSYGAPHYPEVVLATTRKTLEHRRGAIRRALAAIAAGARSAAADHAFATQVIARAAGGGDKRLIRAQVDAVAPALLPPLRLDRVALERWAAFDASTGLLPHRLDVSRAFDFTVAP